MWLGNAVKLLMLVALDLAQAALDPRIVGGTTTTIDQRPYLMQLYYDGSFTCGGSLIKGNLVVTAAHCVEDRVAGNFKVTGGATFINAGGVSRGVKEIIRPSAWDPSTMDFDVAVLVLKTKMVGTNIKLINLCSAVVPNGSTVKVSGWGATSENGPSSDQLQTVDVTKISNDECKLDYSGQDQLTTTMICASATGKDSCYGDSGGPLTYQNELCGVVSWGIGCARVYPGVYTNVVAVSEFLDKVIAKYA